MTAAKSLVAGRVAIDMLAGPSECAVLADSSGIGTLLLLLLTLFRSHFYCVCHTQPTPQL